MLVRVQLGGEERRVGVDEFEAMVRSGEVGPETPVERDGAWISAGEWPDFEGLRASPVSALAARWRAPSVPWVTAIVLGIATRMFFWIRLDPEGSSPVGELLVRNTPDVFERGESWRLITYALLHANLPHLLSNGAGILVAGVALERLLGGTAMLSVLSSSVLVGGVLSAVRMPERGTIGISAGDFGLLGACAALGVRFGGLLPRGAQAAFGSTAALCTLQFFAGGLGSTGVDNWCHFGGLVTGLVLGGLYKPAITAWHAHNRRVHVVVAVVSAAVLLGLALAGDRLIPWTEYRADGVVAERPAWWGVQVSRSGGRGYGASDRESAVSLSTSKHGKLTTAAQIVATEVARIQRLDANAAATSEVRQEKEARATVLYTADGQRRVVSYRVATRGLYATVGAVDVQEGARLADDLVQRGLEQWKLEDPPTVAKSRGGGPTWKGKVDAAVAIAELGELEPAIALFGEARALVPQEDDVDVAAIRVLHALGDARAVTFANDALARFPESRKVIAAAAVVGVTPPI